MSTSEPERRLVHNRLVEVVGEQEADILMEMFPKPDLATQIAELRGELHIEIAGLRAEFKDDIAGLRAEFKDEIAGLRAEFKDDIAGLRAEVKDDIGSLAVDVQRGFRYQTIWMVTTMLTLAGIIVAAFAAFH